MSGGELMRTTLRGGRFEDGSIPLSVLADLYALQTMVVDIAGWRFKQKTGQMRLPRKFDRIYLKLTGLSSGSVVMNIGIDTPKEVLAGVPNQEYFEMAAGDIVDVIGLAEHSDGPLSWDIPNQYLEHFNHIGSDLQNEEALEFQTAKRDVTARLTPQTCERLVRHMSISNKSSHSIFRGTVPEVDQKKMTFRLQQIYGPVIQCQIPTQYMNIIMEAFNGYREGVRILVGGRSIRDRKSRISCVEPVDVQKLDQLDVDSRLDEFRNVQDGWLKDGGVAPDHAGLDWLSKTLTTYYPADLPLPYTYLMADGGVSLEWSFGVKDVTIEVDIKTYKGEWYVYDSANKSISDVLSLDLSEYDSWSWVVKQLHNLKDNKND